ncbi:MAG: acetyl-CoA carboxylase biotin carboxyl carrier protein subunit [Sediminispirochaetaceae bacterium]
MKRSFTFNYNGEEIEVKAERQGNTVVIERDGKEYTVTLKPEENAAPEIPKAGGASAGAAQTGARPSAPSPASSASPATPSSGGGGGTGGGAAAAGDVPAPMTGVIKEILASSGDSVSEGQKVMVMEAMKMDIEVSATSSGSVQEIYVKPNDSVKEGQPLMKIG